MEHIYITASLRLGIAVISAIIAYHLKISIALIEICVGIIAGTLMGKYLPWIFNNNALSKIFCRQWSYFSHF